MKTVKLALMMLCFVSCVREEGIIKIEVSETAGIERLLEYVEVHWASNDNSAKDKNYSISDGNQILQGQVLSISEPEQGQYQIRAIFPVSLKANQSKKSRCELHEHQIYIFPSNSLECGFELWRPRNQRRSSPDFPTTHSTTA